MLYQCKVCGKNRENNHQHYGGESCSACGSFFIRTISTKVEYECTKFYSCLDNPSLEGAQCRGCRFSKCLEIGMNCVELFNNTFYKPINSEIYYTYAQCLHNLFQTCLQYPELLYDFVEKDDSSLIKHKLKNMEESFPPQLQTWSMVLQNNKLEPEEFRALFFSIIYNLNLSWIPPFQQEYIKKCQNQAIIKKAHHFKISENRKETLKKLTEFFSNKFETLYCSTMK